MASISTTSQSRRFSGFVSNIESSLRLIAVCVGCALLAGSPSFGNPSVVQASLYDRSADMPVEGVEVFEESWLTLLVVASNTASEPAALDLEIKAEGEAGTEVLALEQVQVAADAQEQFLVDVWLEGPGAFFIRINEDPPLGRVASLPLDKRPFRNWIESRPPGERPPGDALSPEDQPPGARLPNLIRFALDSAAETDPEITQPDFEDWNGEDYLTFRLPLDEQALGVEIGVEFSDSLDWSDAESSFDSRDIVVSEESDGTLVVRDSTPSADAPSRFARIVARAESLSFEDSNFDRAVRDALAVELNRPELTDPTEPIDFDDAEALTSLFASDYGITDLEGVDQLWNARSLQLSDNPITDLQSLAELPYLTTLQLAGTEVSALTPLANAVGLSMLNLSDTPVTDLSPLVGLAHLRELDLADSSVSDVSDIANMPQLRELSLAGTSVSDITPLDAHPNLKEINLGRSQVDDLDALRDMPELDRVILTDNTALQAESGNNFPLQALLSSSAQQIFLEGTTGLDWNDYDETWLWVDRLNDDGRIVHPAASTGPVSEVLVLVRDEDPSSTAPPFEVSLTTPGGVEERFLVQPGTVESHIDVPFLSRITPHPGQGWRMTPKIEGFTPEDAWRIVGEYDRSIELKTRPVGTLVFEMRKSDYYVEGILVDENGDPLEGETVRITDLETDTQMHVTTDFYGHFHLDFVVPKPDEVLIEPLVSGLRFNPLQTFNARDYGEISPSPFTADERIAFVDDGDLYTIHPDGTDRQQLNARSDPALFPDWSPDGGEILYSENSSDPPFEYSLRRIASDGGSDIEIVGADDFDSGLQGQTYEVFLFFWGSTWASDDTVVFSADAEISSDAQLAFQDVLWETGPNGGVLDMDDILMRDGSAYGYAQTLQHPDFSPDGSEILFTGGKNSQPDYDQDDVPEGVWLLDVSGAEERQLLVEDAVHPSWAPDGSQYAYSKNGELYIQPIDGFGPGAATRLAPNHSDVLRPSWSPDGDWIVYDNDGALYRVRVDGSGDPVYLTDGKHPAWGPASDAGGGE